MGVMVMDRWCILRMSGSNTITVASALRKAGFEAWTPIMVEKRRVGRDRAIREVSIPITPGIVFVRSEGLGELLAFARSPTPTFLRWSSERKRMERHGCPHFSVFRHAGQYPRILDRHLDPLRQAECRSKPKAGAPTFVVGDEVRIPSSAFGGLVGLVERADGQHAQVRFKAMTGELMIRVEMRDLLPMQSAA